MTSNDLDSGMTAPAATSSDPAGSASLPDAAVEAGTLPPNCEHPPWQVDDFAQVYEVGPGLEYETPSDVPWELLEAGSLVRIHARSTPYQDKWVVNTSGTPQQPIVVLGVPQDGQLPVISGNGAMTRSTLDYWNEERGLIKIGGASAPAGPASHITLACLEITNGRPDATFLATDGSELTYAQNAACVYLEDGSSIAVVNNVIHGCGNGIFASSGSSGVTVAGNSIFDNGNVGSIYEHNTYTEALGITFEYNHYGPLCDGCEGNNLKDRSAGTVIRYNWIESGNRQLDLVESDHAELVGAESYARTFVYGNVLIEPEGAGNSQILHYGGDGDDLDAYRKGTLYFYFNTVVSLRSGNTTVFRLSTEDESVWAFNNVFSVAAEGSSLAVSAGSGQVRLTQNWMPSNWVNSHDELTGAIEMDSSVEGSDPGFADAAALDFTPGADSPCIDRAEVVSWDSVHGYAATMQYAGPRTGVVRPNVGSPDIGAFERP